MYEVTRVSGRALKPAHDAAPSTGGEWGAKPAPVTSKRARRAAAAGAPKVKFATVDGVKREVRQARARDARPYPSAPVGARPGSNVAVTVMRGYAEHIPHLPFRRIGAELEIGRKLSKAEQANQLPFVPEFQAEGQPFPRTARDKSGRVMPRVRTDNGMTKQLQGRGIARREGEVTYTKRQLASQETERRARLETTLEVVRLHEITREVDDTREDAKRALRAAIGRERDALARGDQSAAELARADVRSLRKASRFKG